MGAWFIHPMIALASFRQVSAAMLGIREFVSSALNSALLS